jgi:SAM-dependent methyltransferase
MAWFNDWFGADYLDLYAHRDAAEAAAHVDFLAAWWGGRQPRRVLDLACGAGRHTAALVDRGIAAVGIDLSLLLLVEGPGLPRVRGDMRQLPFADDTFDFVLNAFTSFGYFDTERENFTVLEEMVRVLTPGGAVLIDFLNRERALARLVASESREEDGQRVDITRWFDADRQRINKRIVISGADTAAPREFLESVRAYRREEVEIGLQWAGLELAAVYGGFDGTPWSAESDRLILIGKKAPPRDVAR